jgi:hypothetical protein
MNLSYTIEEFEFAGDWLTLELDLEYTISPYTPMSMYGGPDHVGWPAEGGEIEDLDCKITAVINAEGHALNGHLEELQGAFDKRFEQYRDAIETYIREHHNEADHDDRDD